MPAEQGIEPSVARILVQSRINNARRGLVGALYFGDGCFFQCLEGRADEVDRLYAALLQDPRHTDLKVLARRPIERTSFSTWSMKYVPLDAPMKALLRQQGLPGFNPCRFGEATSPRCWTCCARAATSRQRRHHLSSRRRRQRQRRRFATPAGRLLRR